MSTMTPERAAEDLEKMWDEGPPTCEITKDGVKCGCEAAWTLQCKCTLCAGVSTLLFVCGECRDKIIKPTWYIACKHCPGRPPMTQDWRPL